MKPSGGGGGVARPSATAGVPTSAVTTTSSSVTQSWQEVTRTTRYSLLFSLLAQCSYFHSLYSTVNGH